MEVEPTLEQEIQKGQLEDAKIQEIKEIMEAGKEPDFTEDEQGIVWFWKRICVLDVDHLREKILQEAHDSALFNPSWQYQDVPGLEGEISVVWYEA
jgi:hypothetical protein